MLKRISVDHLRVGMFLHEICGSWMEHPFWRNRFQVEDAEDIQRLQACSIREVWIDTDRGLDVEAGQAIAEEEAEAEVSQVLNSAAYGSGIVKQVSMADEVERAAKICAKAKLAVTSMFNEARMGHALDAADALPLVEEISNSISRNPGAVISLARLKTKDDYTYMHSVAVCALMVALARQLELDEQQVRLAGLAGLLHDIGKMMVPLELLNKPGKLTDDEFDAVKNHPGEGHKLLLEGKGISETALDVCLHHHEKINGTGYPEGLAGDQISLFAKMGAVCDVYDAITSNRPYKNGWDPAESLRKMAEWSKDHFDSAVFQSFVKSLGIYPIGSLVRLESGRLGVVVEQTEKSLLMPKVRVFYSTKSNVRIRPELLDLARAGEQDSIASREDPEKWNFGDLDILWGGGRY